MEHNHHSHGVTDGADHVSEENRIQQLIKAQVDQLLQKRKEVLSKVQTELDDIDRALRQLGHGAPKTHSTQASKQKRRTRISDEEIKNVLRGFMVHGTHYSGAEILKKSGMKPSRFANFKAANKGFLSTHGPKRAMTYSLQ
ncbi:MAG: hypothetical protein EBS01_08895 [Verrucomicrobia bacterium]|nr:hypothetical protein [Verrucomicrobiota bacterium]